MATCARESGFLFWKKRCDGPSIGPCDECRLFICQTHGNIRGDGGLTCNTCYASDNDTDSDSSSSSGSWFSSSSSSSSSDSSSDSSSSDSSSSDSGSSDSSSSSSD